MSATRHLSWEEDGAYRRLLDVYYTTEKPLPIDHKQVCRLILATTETQREAVKTVLEEFFESTPDGWINHRADQEIDAMRDKQQKQRDKAKLMWDKRRAASGTSQPSEQGNAPAMPLHKQNDAAASNKDADALPPTPTPTPTPTPIKEKRSASAPTVQCPDDVDKQVWADWVQLRKGKRATVSLTVIGEARVEAKKAGMTLERFLSIWCARGSQGLMADWLKPNERVTAVAMPSESFRERDDRKGKERWQEMTGRIHPDLAPKASVIDITPRMELSA